MALSKSAVAATFILVVWTLGGCANRHPVLNCKVYRTFLIEGEKVRVESNATDPDKKDRGRLSVAWSSSGGTITPKNGSAEFDSTGLEPGRYEISADVSDGVNAVACSLKIVVDKRQQAPEIVCDPNEFEITELESQELRAQATDPNGDELSYEWTVDEHFVEAESSDFLFDGTELGQGNHRVRVTATDVDGMSASCDFSVFVKRRPHRLPTVALSLEKSNLDAGDTLGASAVASEPDEGSLTYSWELDGRARAETSSRIRINTRGLAAGLHTISVTVSDEREGHDKASEQISVREKMIVHIDRLELDSEAQIQLSKVAQRMSLNLALRATIEGHTDDRGRQEANLRFGHRRAEAAKDYIVDQHAIAPSRIEIRSSGEAEPLGDNRTPEGRRTNRRVELILSHSDGLPE